MTRPGRGQRPASPPARRGQRDDPGAGRRRATVEAAELAVAAGFRTLKLKAGHGGHDGDAGGARRGRARSRRRRRRASAGRQRDVGPGGGGQRACGRWPGSRCSTWSSRSTRGRWPRAAALRRSGRRPDRGRRGGHVAWRRPARVLDAGAADVLVVKPSRVGGPVAVAEIATLAAERGVPVVISSLFETGVGLAPGLACAAALPDVPGWPAAERDHGLATADLLRDDLLVAPLLVEGRADAGSRRPAERWRSGSRSTSPSSTGTRSPRRDLVPGRAPGAARARRRWRDRAGRSAAVGLTWAELDARASAVAASLAGAGIAAGDRVALVGSGRRGRRRGPDRHPARGRRGGPGPGRADVPRGRRRARGARAVARPAPRRGHRHGRAVSRHRTATPRRRPSSS